MTPPRAAIPKLGWIPIAIAAIIILVGWVKLFDRARNDFVNHYENGRRLVAGEFIYSGGLNRVYPPFWSMIHAPLTIVSKRVAMLLVYPLGAAAMVGLVVILKKLADRHWPLSSERIFWSSTVAVLLAATFLERDLGEAGVNSFLVMLSWLGIYLWSKGRDVAGGLSLGLAAAMKCTPIIFVGYFLWKRQWKIAAVAMLTTVLLTLSPMIFQGPAEWWRATKYWAEGVKLGMSDPDPSRGVLGQEKVENLSLRPAMARYLMALPYGHMGRPETSDNPERKNAPENPYYVHFGRFSPEVAGPIVRWSMVAFALFVLWQFRKPASDRTDLSILWECAALSVVILLYSPVTWRQHCAGVLPALYFCIRAIAARAPVPRAIYAMLIIYILFTVIFQRGIFGREISKLFDAYRLKTIAFLLLLIVTLVMHHLARRRQAQESGPPPRVAGSLASR